MRQKHDLRILETFADSFVRRSAPPECDDVIGGEAIGLQYTLETKAEVFVEQEPHMPAEFRRRGGRLAAGEPRRARRTPTRRAPALE